MVILFNDVDIMEELAINDMLIADYSSAYVDYLLLERPIIFASFDIEKYLTQDRELYYDYNEVTPGPICKDWNDVEHWIGMMSNDSSLYKGELELIKKKFHQYDDGKSSERVYKYIKGKLDI